MLNITKKHAVKIHGANTIGCILGPEDGTEVCTVLIKFEVHVKEKELGCLPCSTEALEAHLKESKGIKKGKNSTGLKVKRSYGLGTYSLTLGDMIVGFQATIENTPTIDVVMGKVIAYWTAKAHVSPEVSGQLDRLPKRDGIKIKCSQPILQKELPLKDEATG